MTASFWGRGKTLVNGRIIVINGGFSKACQSTTSIAGYTLLYNSYGMQLVTHKHFNSKAEVLSTGTDVLTVKRLVDKELERKKVKETNVGEELLQEVAILESLREYRVYEVRDVGFRDYSLGSLLRFSNISFTL